MEFEKLLQAEIYAADLRVVDAHFASIGIQDANGMLHLKSALVTLANVCDFEGTVRASYKEFGEPGAVFKRLRKQFELAKYLRNKFVGHIHPELLAKALEWQPTLRQVLPSGDDPNVMVLVNLWLLETAINTYVDGDGKHKVFPSETDLMYPPDWQRFAGYLVSTIRGGIEYLALIRAYWAPLVAAPQAEPFSLEAALRAGRTEFKYLAR
jgi:hypothetical protein